MMINSNIISPGIWGRELADNQVHIWQVSLDRPVSRFHRLVSPDERNRAKRFHFERDGNRFIVRRGILRTILGSYLNIEPGAIRLYFGSNNKPVLVDELNKADLHFNLSHSGGLGIYAFSHGHEIGVDIEYVRDIPEMEQLAGQILTPKEKAEFKTLSKSKRKEAFFDCWTRKEAFVKATGDGLSRSLNEIEISPVAGDSGKILAANAISFDSSQWFVYDLNINGGYKAAFAREKPCWDLACFQWL